MTITLGSPLGFKDHNALCKAAADRIIALVRNKPNAVIGLATGGTMEPLYAEIVKQYNESKGTQNPIDFSKITFFTLDEYVGLQKNHEQSYHSYLHHHLLNHINATSENINIPNGNAADINEECKRYEAAIKKAGGVDLWIVGIGSNGHVAFNEPKSKIYSPTSKVTLTEKTRQDNKRFFDGEIAQVPTQAISVGLGTIKDHAKTVLLLASGAGKSEAVAGMLNLSKIGKRGFDPNVPASALNTMENVTIYADEAALAGYLKENPRSYRLKIAENSGHTWAL